MYEGFEVIDFHAHFPTDRPWFPDMGDTMQRYTEQRQRRRGCALIQQKSQPYQEQWRRMWDFPKAEGKEQHPGDREQARRWVAELDKYGIRAIGFVTGGGNEHLAEVVQLAPRPLYRLCPSQPLSCPTRWNGWSVPSRSWGCAPISCWPPTSRSRLNIPTAFPVWEKCAELGIPVLIHFGIQGGAGGIAWHENINPLKLHNVAKSFPEVTFVIPHFGCAWERETLQLCWACPNVSVDTSGSNQWIRWVPGEVTVKYLFRKYYETIGPEPHHLWQRF
ncbi:MAG: amidohydrolase family protein [Rhodoblastus sp.]